MLTILGESNTMPGVTQARVTGGSPLNSRVTCRRRLPARLCRGVKPRSISGREITIDIGTRGNGFIISSLTARLLAAWVYDRRRDYSEIILSSADGITIVRLNTTSSRTLMSCFSRETVLACPFLSVPFLHNVRDTYILLLIQYSHLRPVIYLRVYSCTNNRRRINIKTHNQAGIETRFRIW